MNLESITRSLKNLKFVAGDDLIEFYCDPKLFDVIPHPRPASKSVAPWFKQIKPISDEIRDQFDAKSKTAKRCSPLIDAMTAGWIIPLFGDVNVRTNGDCSLIEAGPNELRPPASFHSVEQLGGADSPFPGPAIKFINPWVIKTAAGVSSFFMPPVNHFDKRFTCFSGLVDTDKYPKEVNFPAIWHIADHDDVVPAGTALVTVIPVRRADLAFEARPRKMTKREADEIGVIHLKQSSRRGVYTDELREPRK